MPETIAIIPAPARADRLPLRSVAGRPLLGWAIEASRSADRVDRVIVATDDPEAAAFARRAGAAAIVLDRPPGPNDETARRALDRHGEAGNPAPGRLAILSWNCPLLLPADLDGTIAALDRDGADSRHRRNPGGRGALGG